MNFKSTDHKKRVNAILQVLLAATIQASVPKADCLQEAKYYTSSKFNHGIVQLVLEETDSTEPRIDICNGTTEDLRYRFPKWMRHGVT
jgi:hypothetical protein